MHRRPTPLAPVVGPVRAVEVDAAMAMYAARDIDDINQCVDLTRLFVFRDRARVDGNRVYIPVTSPAFYREILRYTEDWASAVS